MYRGREREDTTQFLYEINKKVSASERDIVQPGERENKDSFTQQQKHKLHSEKKVKNVSTLLE
uniref:Uncharacterized protein n=1 Tax=Myotis lucifugus TaxID=59463 RepID=G1QGE0_MYOLU